MAAIHYCSSRTSDYFRLKSRNQHSFRRPKNPNNHAAESMSFVGRDSARGYCVNDEDKKLSHKKEKDPLSLAVSK